MNKGLFLVLKMASMAGALLNPFAYGGSRYTGRTPGMPHSKHYREARPSAPNDGHWHLKFHRGRV